MTKGPIFLSAGVPYPDPKRNPDGKKYICQATQVREAIRGLVSVVVRDRRLVFGGQPAVTRFVWDAANSLNAQDSVTIYQSKYFERTIPPQARFFSNLIWTPASDPNDVNRCLETMRHQMIVDRSYDPGGAELFPKYDGAVFIGGMDGVENEWNIFRKAYPSTPVFPIGSTAGAAKKLLVGPWSQAVLQIKWHSGVPQVSDLAGQLNYRRLFRLLIN